MKGGEGIWRHRGRKIVGVCLLPNQIHSCSTTTEMIADFNNQLITKITTSSIFKEINGTVTARVLKQTYNKIGAKCMKT
jgi:hypothetical protein